MRRQRTLHSVKHVIAADIAVAASILPVLASALACPQANAQGAVVTTTLTTPALEGNSLGNSTTRQARVYLPPGYESSERRYPVLYFLHGTTGDENSFFSRGGHRTADRLIERGEIAEMIIVGVDGSSNLLANPFINSELHGNYGDYIVRDLVNHVDTSYRTIADRDSRGVFGNSMGGYGSLRMAMEHADVFGAAYSHSAGLVNYSQPNSSFLYLGEDSAEYPNEPDAATLLAQVECAADMREIVQLLTFAWASSFSPNLEDPQFPCLNVDLPFELPSLQIIPEVRDDWMEHDVFRLLDDHATDLSSLRGLALDVGDQEIADNLPDNTAFHEALLSAGVPHQFEVYRGGHVDWSEANSLQFLTENLIVLFGDFDGNGILDNDDIALLGAEVRRGTNDLGMDVNGDGLVDMSDHTFWVKHREVAFSYFGDANLNGEFNSGDLVAVFGAGEYEDATEGNSLWSEGDWNGDGDFDTTDLVVAFQDGGYEQGPRVSAHTVPEPATNVFLTFSAMVLLFKRRSKHIRWLMVLAIGPALICSTSNADIFRWDDGELIPGTEGIEPGPGVSLWNLDLTAANLASTNLANSFLSNSNLTNADLSAANLSRAIVSYFGEPSTLENANLSAANLSDALLHSANVTNADFSAAIVTGTDFGNTTLHGFTKEQLYSTSSYQERNLQGIVLSGNDLTSWDFFEQDLSRAALQNSNLTNSAFRGANLTNAQVSSSTFTGADLTGAIVTGADFGQSTSRGFTKELFYSTSSYQAKDLRGVRLFANDLTEWDFGERDLSNASFQRSTLTDTNLTGTIVNGANFSDTTSRGLTREQFYTTASYDARNLERVLLSYNDLTEWNSRDQNLTKARFESSTLSGANFSGAVVNGVNFGETTSRGFSKDQLYSTASYGLGNLQSVSLNSNDLSGWDFGGQNLTHADVSRSSLGNASFQNADLTNANLSTSTLTDAELTGAVIKGADFRETSSRGFTEDQLYSTASYQSRDLRRVGLRSNDLSGWDFSGQVLSGSNISLPNSTTNLKDANLAGANLTGASLSNATLTNTDLTGAIITRANFSGTVSHGFTKEQLYSTASYSTKDLRGIRLGNSDLTGWDYSGQDLSGAFLQDAILTDANLSEAIVSGTNLQGTLASGLTREQFYSTASYQNKDLRGIKLSGSNLSGWDFTGQDLSGAWLRRAILWDTSFADANLSNAFLADADLSGVDLSNTNLFGANLRNTKGFSPVASTETRNAILPDGKILGLELRAGEYLSVRDYGEIQISEGVNLDDDSIFEINVSCFYDCVHGHLTVAPDVAVKLGGTLRIVSNPAESSDGHLFLQIVSTSDYFDWSAPFLADNVFSSIELPAGAWDLSQLYTDGSITATGHYRWDGDFDVDGSLDSDDIDRLSIAVRAGRDLSFDVNRDWQLDEADRMDWIHEFAKTYLGDSNFDGKFNSSDFVHVFQAGEYEDAIAMNSTWSEGDWNGDGDFDSADLVVAFQDGGYELGPRVAVRGVPEPSGGSLLVSALILWLLNERSRARSTHEFKRIAGRINDESA